MKRAVVMVLVVMILAVGLAFGGGRSEAGAPGQTGPVTLRMATAFTLSTHQEVGARMLIEKIEQRLGNQIRIQYVGGPEAINSFELMEAVRNGVVDIGGLPGSYFEAAVPEAATMYLSQVTPAEERANGTYEIYRRVIAERANAHYLGRYNTSYKFNFYTIPAVRTMRDFAGVKIRISPVYRAFLTALGGAPITMPHSEVYTGLERGLVEGIGVTNFGVIERGWHDKVRYVIDPPFYGSDQVFVVNLNAWNRIPAATRQAIEAIVIEVESESGLVLQRIIDDERIALVDQGVQVINIADGAAYVKLAYDSAWQAILTAVPDTGAQLKRLISR